MEYIWFYGLSAVGKAWVITKLRHTDEELRNYFGIDGRAEITTFGIGQEPGEDFTADEVAYQELLSSTAPVALLKFQFRYKDLTGRLINDRRDARHRVVLLWHEPTLHLRRYKEKHGNNPKMVDDGVIEALRAEDNEGATGKLKGAWDGSLVQGMIQTVREVLDFKPDLRVEVRDASTTDYAVRFALQVTQDNLDELHKGACWEQMLLHHKYRPATGTQLVESVEEYERT